MIKNDPSEFHPPLEKLFGIYRGVVEDNNDPEKRGRCKIRIFGLHSENLVLSGMEGIPVEDLPWSEVVLPVLEGSVTGFGFWSVPLQGSHVFLFFENGNIQFPKYFASAPGIPVNPKFEAAAETFAVESYQTSRKQAKKVAKELKKDVKENPSKAEYQYSSELGGVSKRFESGSKGPRAISSGKGDAGGVSYGSYQFASNRGSVEPFIKTLPPEQQSKFAGKTPGTPAFNDAWNSAVDDMGEDEFHKYEHAHIKKQFYDKGASKLQNDTGINVDERCDGVKDLVWSTSVQNGPGSNVLKNAKLTPDMTDEEIIKAAYKEKSRVDSYFSKCSPDVQESVRKRYQAEEKMALAKCREGQANPPAETPPPENTVPEELSEATEEQLAEDTQLEQKEYIERTKKDYAESYIQEPSDTGFCDPDGIYPLAHRLNEPDYHRLSRGESAETLVDIKTSNRITGIPISRGGTFDEHAPAYAAEYPHNIVLATHSGIMIEIDSTPHKQRFQVYHPSNTFIEIDAGGNMMVKNTGNKTEITELNSNQYVLGNARQTVDGHLDVLVGNTIYQKSISNTTIIGERIDLNPVLGRG